MIRFCSYDFFLRAKNMNVEVYSRKEVLSGQIVRDMAKHLYTWCLLKNSKRFMAISLESTSSKLQVVVCWFHVSDSCLPRRDKKRFEM